ncbi:unnamed protein product [Coregonus sp. 'balchen']|nr:unnamed protein product [Coregonus sp. 'balchen']
MEDGMNGDRNMEDHLAFLITVPTTLFLFLSIFILVCIESVFNRMLRLFSLLIWACLVAMGYLFMFSGGILCPWDQVSFFLFIVFVVYTMLPFSMRGAVLASIITCLSHTITLSVCLAFTAEALEPLVWQILANIIIFTCGNLAGAYHKHLMDLALRQTYQDTCNCIKSPIKLEFEKHQQPVQQAPELQPAQPVDCQSALQPLSWHPNRHSLCLSWSTCCHHTRPPSWYQCFFEDHSSTDLGPSPAPALGPMSSPVLDPLADSFPIMGPPSTPVPGPMPSAYPAPALGPQPSPPPEDTAQPDPQPALGLRLKPAFRRPDVGLPLAPDLDAHPALV